MFSVTHPPASENPKDLADWVFGELSRIAGLLDALEQGEFLDIHTAAPSKPQERQIVFADGTNWNPGSGTGVYCYYNSSWHFLG